MKNCDIISDVLACLFILIVLVGFFACVYNDLNNLNNKNKHKIVNKNEAYIIFFILTAAYLLYLLAYLCVIFIYEIIDIIYEIINIIIKYNVSIIMSFLVYLISIFSLVYLILIFSLVYLILIFKNYIIKLFLLFILFNFILVRSCPDYMNKVAKKAFEYLEKYIYLFYLTLIILTVYVILYCTIRGISLFNILHSNLVSAIFLGMIIVILNYLSKEK